MNLKSLKKLTLYMFFIYFGIYFLPQLTGPQAYILPIQNLLTLVISAVTFFVVYKVTFNNNISRNIVSYVQTFAVIILVVLLFFNPLNKVLGPYFLLALVINGYLATVLIALYLLTTVYTGYIANLKDYSAIIILLPYLIQAIITYIFKMGNIYLQFPYINLIIILILYFAYTNYIKKK